jgi:hypothetical protein
LGTVLSDVENLASEGTGKVLAIEEKFILIFLLEKQLQAELHNKSVMAVILSYTCLLHTETHAELCIMNQQNAPLLK